MLKLLSKRKIFHTVEKGIIFFEFASLPLKFKAALTTDEKCVMCV
jgi:hypothetical protein